MSVSWQELEKIVRDVAEVKFGGLARPETIAGVKCDCILRLADESVIAIEMSKEHSIDKLRTDLAKFQTIRPHFTSQDLFLKCFFVTEKTPSASLIEAAAAAKVKVFSVSQFLSWVFPLHQYQRIRSTFPFGSSVDLYSGGPDKDEYVPVNYVTDNGTGYTTQQIAEELVAGRSIVLIGNYGAGKSRCISELFELLRKDAKGQYCLTLAINLRENWGLKRASELINRHLEDLGLGDNVDDFMKIAYSSHTVYLLDGFDEIGAQTWSDDPTKLMEIRQQSLAGVNDLISRAKGGVLVAGREHYFNNDVEMLQCLGLTRKDFLILRCVEELSATQFAQMIQGNDSTHHLEIPAWVPKKPLIGKIIREIDLKQRTVMFSTETGQIDFWSILLDAICERESRIRNVLDPNIVRALYSKIGRLCRTTHDQLGPLSIKSINEAFEEVTGRPPTDESAIILQRLPGLGRIAAESLDRQFVDEYILDGLKAEDVLQIYAESPPSVLKEIWKHTVGDFGAFFIATRLQSIQQVPGFFAFVKRAKDAQNRVLLSDMLTALILSSDKVLDFGGQRFWDGKFAGINLAEAPIASLQFSDCYFEAVDITDANPRNVTLRSCVIKSLAGATSADHLPAWIEGALVGDFQSTNTLAAIRQAKLSVAQIFLLSSLRKLFFQPGAGRKHSSMYKGYADLASKKICDKVISLLLREGFCTAFQGATEKLYIPDRGLTQRARAMLNQMTQSTDELWKLVSRLSDRG